MADGYSVFFPVRFSELASMTIFAMIDGSRETKEEEKITGGNMSYER